MLKRSNTVILASALVLLLFPFYDPVVSFVFKAIQFSPDYLLQDYTGESVREVLRSGSYIEGVQLRFAEFFSNLRMVAAFFIPLAGSMFLVGLYLGKNKWYQNLDVLVLKIKKPMLWTALITNAYRVVFLFVLIESGLFADATTRDALIKIMVVCDVVMGIFYLWCIAMIYHYTSWKVILSPLRYVGRMALTNYILQSIIGLILFTSVGFSLYETMSPWQTLATAFTVFSFQIIFSLIWLKYFLYGPLEWLWRILTYRKILPFKRFQLD